MRLRLPLLPLLALEETVMGLPATGYSWPQFMDGNKVSITHGAH